MYLIFETPGSETPSSETPGSEAAERTECRTVRHYKESDGLVQNAQHSNSANANDKRLVQDEHSKRSRIKHRVVIERLFSPKICILLFGGLLLNSGVTNLVSSLGLPLYLDNIGSILAAALGGPLVGIVVGFLSNVLTSINNPISLYYGLITVVNALIAASFSCRGYLKSWKGALALLPPLVFFGGFCGSLLTWVLYDASIGGIGGSLAMILYNMGLAALPSQLTADILIDIPDKAITIFVAMLVLRHFPKAWATWFPLSHVYACSDAETARIDRLNTVPVRKRSLAKQTLVLTELSLFILSTILTVITCLFYAHAVSGIYEMLEFIIQIVAVQFGIALIIIALLTWYLEHHITLPMNALVHQVLAFERADPVGWLESDFWKNRYDIGSGDELEALYTSICQEEQRLSKTVVELRNSHRRLTEAIRLKDQNRELSVQLEQAQAQSEAKAQFYSRMSHDIRTPINSIMGLTQLALSEHELATVKADLEKIESSGKYLLSLVNDTLDMNKLDAQKFILNPKPFNLQKTLRALFESVNVSAQMKHLDISASHEGFVTDIYILADQLRFQQIYMNLVSNAVNYTPQGGSICLVAADRGSDEKTCRARFIVKDTGVGMSADFVENHLFEPFAQEINSESGKTSSTGLGLNIVKRLVDLMGATISCESKLGCGSTFTLDIDFEIVAPDAYSADESVQSSPDIANEKSASAYGQAYASSLAGRRVLLCEDNALNQEIAKRILENAGIEVSVASDGQQALDAFAASAVGDFDAVFMDMRMPVLDGMSATRQIRALNRADAARIPIIAMTADVEDDDRAKMYDAGLSAFVAKPINVGELYATLTTQLNGA